MSELSIIDYPTIAVSLLIERFKDSKEFQKLIDIIAVSAMDLQTTMFEIKDIFTLSTATGIELTIIGNVWDVFRRLDIAETDDEYRGKISVKAVISISGTVSEIKQMLYLFYRATYVDYHGAFPAGYNMLTDAVISEVLLNKITVAGVQGFLGTRLSALTFSYPLGSLAVLKTTLAGE